jgi:hypothetical protein
MHPVTIAYKVIMSAWMHGLFVVHNHCTAWYTSSCLDLLGRETWASCKLLSPFTGMPQPCAKHLTGDIPVIYRSCRQLANQAWGAWWLPGAGCWAEGNGAST